jgi:hypothetical protein
VQGFEYSPQALLLVAARAMLDDVALCEATKPVAADAGLLHQLSRVAAENMAVLTGRRPPDFTDKTNACMWYVPRTCCVCLVSAGAEPELKLTLAAGLPTRRLLALSA